MATWHIIEHGDQSEARILRTVTTWNAAIVEYRTLLAERRRTGHRLEEVGATVWLCARPLRDGRFDGDATVLRLISAHEWQQDWVQFLQEVTA